MGRHDDGPDHATFTVLAPGDNPATDSPLYTDQPMHQGLNYITMRDGIKLAATVRYPYGETCSATSPCPTVIEYSGYNVAGPTDPIPSLLSEALGTPCKDCGDPNLLPDSATAVGVGLARVSGFATVSLQMRGTGCSGGAFDLFGYPSDYDAYDAIEIVAHQSWVAHHKVGMVGISYSGLSQFPSAGTDPPGLAAIAPMSPTDDLFSTGYPGGIYNDGFAASWIGAAYRRRQGGRRLPRRRSWSGWPPPRCRTWASPGPTTRSTPSWRPAADLVDLPGQPGPPRPVGEPGQPGRTPAGRPGHRAGARPRRSSTAGPWSTGPATSRCRSSCPAPSRTSRPARSGRR